MPERRAYCCLMCRDRPVFHNRLAALMHARDAHVALLAEHHVDELFQVSGQDYVEPSDDNVQPPFQCRHCSQTRTTVDGIESHVRSEHDGYRVQYRADYVSQYDLMLEKDAERAELEADVDRFVRVLDSCRGAGDFLVECVS